MTRRQFETLRAAALGHAPKAPVALIVDSPWIPGFVGIGAMEYFTEPDKWLRANLQVVERFGDVIFLPGFWVEYGMAVEPSAFGCKVSWWSDSPPSVRPAIAGINEISRLSVPLPANDGLMPMALHLQKWVHKQIAPLGYDIRMVAARGPLALATHLYGVTEFLTDIKIEPVPAHKLLDLCTETVIRWLKAQAENLPAVESVLVLDDIPGLLSPADYEVFAHPYLTRIFAAFPDMFKIYHNDANVEPFAERLAQAGFDALNFSHQISMSEMTRRIGNRVGLIGNVPPLQTMALGTPEDVRASADQCLAAGCRRLILSVGGGTSPGTPAENVDALAAAAAGT